MIYKENTEQEMSVRIKRCGIYIKTNIYLRSVHRMVFLEDAVIKRHFKI